PFTRTGMQMLTPEYAAPEQFGDGTITTATDVYAMGAVLYELLCGMRPYNFSRHGVPDQMPITTPSEALLRVRRTAASTTDSRHFAHVAAQRDIAPERLRKALRGDLDTIVLKALQVEPERRYATVEAFSDDIERHLRQQPISARKDAGLYRAGKFLRRHAIAVAMGTFAMAALLTATTVSIYQAGRAQTEARHALATKKFLTDLFEVSDAGMPRDQVPSTQALLEEAAKRIRGEFSDAPDVKFDLLLLLGRVQFHLGQYSSAEPLLKEALSIADAHFTPDSIQWLQAHTEWAEVLLEQTHFEQAAHELSTAIAQHRHAGAVDSDALIEALQSMARIHATREQFDPAKAAARQALDMAKHLHGDHDSEVQKALGTLGKVLLRAGQLDEAEKICRADLILSGQLYGEHHAMYATSLTMLADALSQQNKNAESERLARQALAIEESVYDRPNAALIDTLSALNDSLYNLDKLDESESVLKRWLAAQTQLSAPGDPSTTPILMNLGMIADRRHAYQQSERMYRQALVTCCKRHGDAPPSIVADAWRALADELIAQQRLPEAAAAAQKAIAIDRAQSGSDGQRIAIDFTESAIVDKQMGRLQSALDETDEALRILGKVRPADEPDEDEARVQRAAILNRLARSREATDLLMATIPRLRKAGADFESRDRLSRGLTELGRAQSATTDTRAALANWNEALALQLAMKIPDPRAIGELRGLTASTGSSPQDTERRGLGVVIRK
ncbi:MAG TPA: tetratricopeptide repeat protein, partial [Xanthomonadaceae bacterium]|nr:tetratricopeptide repeat protein [Xanthomonadaceae bacterium]